METIYQLNREDLHKEIKNCIRELLEELKTSQEKPLPDHISLDEACEITGLGKASIYAMTHNKKIPFKHFGRRLVFSRKELILWMESHTTSDKTRSDAITENLRKSAIKHLKKANIYGTYL